MSLRDENGKATFEDLDGVPGVNIYGPEYPMDDPAHGMYRTGYWRPLSEDELLIVASLREQVTRLEQEKAWYENAQCITCATHLDASLNPPPQEMKG